MVLVFSNGSLVTIMKENSLMMLAKDMVLCIGLMAAIIKAIGKEVSKMVKESSMFLVETLK